MLCWARTGTTALPTTGDYRFEGMTAVENLTVVSLAGWLALTFRKVIQGCERSAGIVANNRGQRIVRVVFVDRICRILRIDTFHGVEWVPWINRIDRVQGIVGAQSIDRIENVVVALGFLVKAELGGGWNGYEEQTEEP